MRTLVHLSDIHFGRVDQAIIEPLINLITELKPDVVAVSGDLTQRARSQQFKEARAFLDRLPKPQIVVPGNHDVPLYNIFARFITPLDKYRQFITEDLSPFYADEEVAVLGVNTARSLTIKGGRVNEEQVA
jgi:3',5'-cyclic AMP phosphodiesterase CpdA